MAKKRAPAPPDLPPDDSASLQADTPNGVTLSAVADDSTSDNDPIEEVEEAFRDYTAIDFSLQEYIAQEGLVQTEYRSSLYKFDKIKKTKQSLVDSDVGRVLTADEIGMAFGSGEYRYVIYWPGKKRPDNKPYFKTFRINISENYDLKRAAAGMTSLSTSASLIPTTAPQNPVEAAIQLVGALVQLQQQSGARAALGGPVDMVGQVQQQQMIDKMMMQSSMQYVEFMREMRKRMLSLDGESLDEEGDYEDMEEKDGELVKIVKELAVTFLPKILGKGPGATLAAATVRNLPQFKRVVKDGPTLSHLLKELETDFGKEKVDAACARLKIKRP